MNTFGRYSFEFFRDPTSFGQGAVRSWSASAASRKPEPEHRPASTTLSPLLAISSSAGSNARQRAAVRFRHDAGHHRRDSRSRGQHVQFIAGRIHRGDRGFNFGSGLGVNRCNCRSMDETQWQLVAT
jgi:hypothetical protein